MRGLSAAPRRSAPDVYRIPWAAWSHGPVSRISDPLGRVVPWSREAHIGSPGPLFPSSVAISDLVARSGAYFPSLVATGDR